MDCQTQSPLHGGQGSISLEYQTYTSAHPFDTLVAGLPWSTMVPACCSSVRHGPSVLFLGPPWSPHVVCLGPCG